MSRKLWAIYGKKLSNFDFERRFVPLKTVTCLKTVDTLTKYASSYVKQNIKKFWGCPAKLRGCTSIGKFFCRKIQFSNRQSICYDIFYCQKEFQLDWAHESQVMGNLSRKNTNWDFERTFVLLKVVTCFKTDKVATKYVPAHVKQHIKKNWDAYEF